MGPLAWFVPVAVLFAFCARRKPLWLLAMLCTGLAAVALCSWTFAHYLAPIAGALYFFTIQLFRRLGGWRYHGLRIGRWVAAGILLLAAVVMADRSYGTALYLKDQQLRPQALPYWREKIVDRLNGLGGKHLVLVEYPPDHRPDYEWVYNQGHIDAAAVVWARPMSGAKLQGLLQYYADRRVWRLDGAAKEPKLQPFRHDIAERLTHSPGHH